MNKQNSTHAIEDTLTQLRQCPACRNVAAILLRTVEAPSANGKQTWQCCCCGYWWQPLKEESINSNPLAPQLKSADNDVPTVLYFGVELGESWLEHLSSLMPLDGCNELLMALLDEFNGIKNDVLLPFILGRHRSYDCNLYYLALRRKLVKAGRVYFSDLDPRFFEIAPAVVDEFILLAKRLGVKTRPSWHLYSHFV